MPVKDRHSAHNNMRCNNEIWCAGCVKWDAHGAHVVHKHIWTSLVYTLQCHSYTTSSITNILSLMSLIFSLLCQGYTHSCLRAFLTSAYEVRISNQVVTRAKTMTKEEHENNKKTSVRYKESLRENLQLDVVKFCKSFQIFLYCKAQQEGSTHGCSLLAIICKWYLLCRVVNLAHAHICSVAVLCYLLGGIREVR